MDILGSGWSAPAPWDPIALGLGEGEGRLVLSRAYWCEAVPFRSPDARLGVVHSGESHILRTHAVPALLQTPGGQQHLK